MSTNVYALAFEQAINDLSWIDRELERLNAQQKQLTELLHCLKHFVPEVHAPVQEHSAECAEKPAMAEAPVSHSSEHEAAGQETSEPAAVHVEHAVEHIGHEAEHMEQMHG